MWFGVAPISDIKKSKCLKEIGLCAQNTITIPGSIVNILKGEGLYNPFNAYKSLHLENDEDMHMSFDNNEESRYNQYICLTNFI